MKKTKVLLIKFGAIGDLVHSTVIPQSIKLKHPECEIHYLTLSRYVDLLSMSPYIDKVISYNNSLKLTIKQLLTERYDCIFSLNYTLKMILLSMLSFPKKVFFRNYKGKSWVENYFYIGKQFYKDLELPSNLHFVPNSEEDDINQLLSAYKRPFFVLSPGGASNCAREGRVWHINKWSELSDNLVEKYGGTVFVIGASDELTSHKRLDNGRNIILTGKLPLKQSCKLLSKADVVISGDSGPVHIASAFNVNTLVLLGSTSPDKIKPYGDKGLYISPKIDCKYCWQKKCKKTLIDGVYAPCIESISVEDVMEKLAVVNLDKSEHV